MADRTAHKLLWKGVLTPTFSSIENHSKNIFSAWAASEAEETVTQACVSGDSSLVGKTLKEARVHDETGMWVLVIRREDKCLRPREDSKIAVGDVLVARGYAEGADALKRLASPTETLQR